MKLLCVLLLFSFALASCAPATPPATPQLVDAYVTSAAYPRGKRDLCMRSLVYRDISL